MNSELVRLFDTPLFKVKVSEEDISNEVHNGMKNWVMNQYNSYPSYRIPSGPKTGGGKLGDDRGVWQTRYDVHKNEAPDVFNPFISDLKNIVRKSTNWSFRDLTVPKLWCNVNHAGEYCSFHNHAGYYDMSCIYYIQTPENCSRLVFRDPRPGAIISPFTLERHNGGDQYWIQPEERLMILFPSFFEHATDVGDNNEPRIVLSCDMIMEWQ